LKKVVDVTANAPRPIVRFNRDKERRKMQAKVDTASRPDYVGPPVVALQGKVETGPPKPKLRTSPANIGPVEPPLPSSDAPKPNQ